MMYAFIGWCYEVFLEVVVYRWGFSNRGFLFGPYLPVYGFGAIAFVLCFGALLKRKEKGCLKFVKPLLIFLACMLLATAIELVTSYIMEFFCGSWPWQTYRDYKINFQGRIALSPSIRFGLGGMFFLYVLQPLFEKAVAKLSPLMLNVVFYSAAFLITVDLLLKIVILVSQSG